MCPEANLFPGQEPQVRLRMAILGYQRGGGRIHKSPEGTDFHIDGAIAGIIKTTGNSIVFYCPPKIVEALDRKDLNFHYK
jgi:hypothetical protein